MGGQKDRAQRWFGIGIVEDELILGLPERLCENDPCELQPGFNYPACSDERDSEQDNEANPFNVLVDLKTQNRDL